MRTLINLAAILVIVAISACSKPGSVKEEYGPDGKSVVSRTIVGGSDYESYLQAVSKSQPPVGVDPLACAGDAQCVRDLAREATLQEAFRALGAGRNVIAPPPQGRTGWDRVESVAKAVIGVTPALGGIYASIESSKEGRREREALYGTFSSLGHDLATLGAVPSYQVGGDYIGRDRTETNTSTTVGGNLGDTQTIGGNLGDTQTIGRDQIGGDRIDNAGVIGDDNDTRFGSDGPFDDDHSDPGDDCTGDCSTQPVEPVP